MRTLLVLLLLCLNWTQPLAQGVEEELLRPEQAFALRAEPAGESVRLIWDIADGYYLYKDKLRFSSGHEAVTLGEPRLPPGEVKNDEFFGRMEIYRGRLSVELPVQRRGAVENLTIETVSQGCADLGVCYPPHTQRVSVDLPAPHGSGAQGQASGDPLAALKDLGRDLGLGPEANEFLPAEQAFRFASQLEQGALVASWDIAPGYYLYKDKLSFTLVDGAGASLGAPALPQGETKDDPEFGRVQVYHNFIQARVPLRWSQAQSVQVQVGYQGCAEAGICYPPTTRTVSLDLPAGGPPQAQASGAAGAVPESAVPEPVSEQDRLAALLGQDRLVAVLAFFGFGLLLAFTPCVFPMIPILSGIIAGQGSPITTRKAFFLSLTYVLAMSVTYTVAGVIAGKFGHNLQAALQNPWMLSIFAAVFVLLALSMFGFYDLQLPASWQSRLTEISNQQQGGTLVGVAIMGLLSALIVGPCVAPPLAGALIYIGQTGDPWLGGMALFALSLGMGAPLVVVGTLEGRFLPRAGGWMNAVKAVFGVLMLGVALYLLDRVLPAWVTLLLWAALFIVSAIYMGALEPLGNDAGGFRKLWKGLGAVLMVYGVLLMIGAASGAGDMVHPLRAIASAGAGQSQSHDLDFRQIKGPDGLEAELAAASAASRPVMLDFYADWCVSCKELERYTFSDPGVQAALDEAVLLQADVTPNDARDQALLSELGLIGPPAILFYGPDGRERRGYRLVGFMGADEFREHARAALR